MTDIATIEVESAEAVARREFVTGLREMADFIEAHAHIPLPWPGSQNAFVSDKAELAAIAKACGGRWAKNATESFFYIKKPFSGGHSYEVNISRESVCRRVVVGTRIEPAQPEQEVEDVRWVCDEPLLSEV